MEHIKKAEHYDLVDALQNWETKPNISIHQALTAISMMGGQGSFFCNCKGSCDKNTCKKNGKHCNSNCHPSTGNVSMKVRLSVIKLKLCKIFLIISCAIPELDNPFQNGIGALLESISS